MMIKSGTWARSRGVFLVLSGVRNFKLTKLNEPWVLSFFTPFSVEQEVDYFSFLG